MEDLLKPTPRTIELGGETLALRFELQDFRRAEKALKVALFPIGTTTAWREASALDQASLLAFIGLQHSKPDITVDWIDEHITTENYGKVNADLREAVLDFFAALVKLPRESLATALNQTEKAAIGIDLPHGVDSIIN